MDKKIDNEGMNFIIQDKGLQWTIVLPPPQEPFIKNKKENTVDKPIIIIMRKKLE